MSEEPSVRITLDTIYGVVVETKSKVELLDTKIDSLAKKDDDHEGRIRALEKKIWVAAGLAAAGGATALEVLSRTLSA